jgi:hypothetical protein
MPLVSERKGIVWIAPEPGDEPGDECPPDRMVDPDSSLFWVSWQVWNEEEDRQDHYENDGVVGADDAIRWGRDRADVVLIRLDGNTYFSAGDDVLTEDPWEGHPLPSWPPPEPPEGWWKMSDAFIRERLRKWQEDEVSEEGEAP